MPKRPDGKAAKTQPTAFTRPAAERIARVVRIVEKGNRNEAPLTFRRVAEAGGGKTFRVATFTGAWAIDAMKTVTFKYVTSTPNTVSAINLFCSIFPVGAGDVSIQKDGNLWHLVQPNMTQLPGYSTSGTQVLTIQGGFLSWLGTTAC